MVLMAIGYFAAPRVESVPLVTASMATICIGAGIAIPTFVTWVMSFLQPTARGRGVGLWQGAFFLGQFVAPITAVFLTTQVGGFPNALMVYAGLASLVGVVALLRSHGRAALS